MKKLLTLAFVTAFTQSFLQAQTATLSEPLNSFSILSGTSVTSKQNTNVEGSVGAIGTVDTTVIAKDTTLQGSVCVTQRALDSFNVVRNRLKQIPAQTYTTTTLSNATLSSGTYKYNSSLTLSGTITLAGDSTSVYVFNVDRSLTFDANTQLILSGGVKAENVFFNVDSSVTIKDSAVICGNILADGTICCSKDISATGTRLMSADSVCLVNSRDTLGTTPDKQLVLFGSTCGCAIDLGNGDTCINNITMTDSVMWFKFTTNSQRVSLLLTGDTANAYIDSLIIYENGCDNSNQKTFFHLIDKDSLPLDLWVSQLSPNNSYFIKINRTTSNPTVISLCKSDQSAALVACPAHPCDFIGDGNFSGYVTGCGGTNPFSFWGGSCVQCWKSSHGSPQVLSAAGNNYAAMWHDGGLNKGEGILIDPPFIPTLQNGKTYLLTYNMRRDPNNIGPNVSTTINNTFAVVTTGLPPNAGGQANGEPIPNPVPKQTVDNVINFSSTTWTQRVICFQANSNYDQLFIYPQSTNSTSPSTCWLNVDDVSLKLVDDAGANQTVATCGSSVQIGPVCPIPGANYSWLPTSGLSCTNCSNPIASPLITTTYTMTISIPGGCTINAMVTITVPPPPQFTITGPSTACDPNKTFCFTPFPSGSSITSTAGSSPGITFFAPFANCVTVNSWGPYATNGQIATICLTVTDANGCSAQKCINVNGCCVPAGISIPPSNQFVNATIATTPAQPFFGDFSVNGTLTIGGNNTTVTFYSSNLIMGPNALIIVQPTCTLNLVGTGCFTSTTHPTHLYAGCGYMWRGIHLMPGNSASQTAGILISGGLAGGNYVLIEDADSAVVSVGNNFNAGQYLIGQTWFNKNYKGIVVTPFAGTLPGIVVRSIFTCRALQVCSLFVWTTRPFTTLLPPHLGTRSLSGVELRRVADIQIGDPAQNSFRNFFDNLDYGIYATISKFRVYNNTFQNINKPNIFSPVGIGIYSAGGKFISPPGPPPMGTTVGGSGLQANTFTNTVAGAFTGIGVFVENFMPAVDITNNTFTRNYFSAAFVSNCPGTNTIINISNNTITEIPTAPFIIYTAIGCRNVTGSTTNITGNTMTDVAPISAAKVTTGISVQNVNAANMNLLIANNTIIRHRTGIFLIGVTGSAMPTINNNTITFSPMLSSYASAKHYGIRMQNCSNVHVKFNIITRAGPNPTSGMVPTLQGINAENSQSCIIGRNNTMTKMGSGIFVSGNCITSRFACNTLNNCYNGFFFDGTANPTFLTDQILDPSNNTTPRPTANIWNGTVGVNADLAGQISTFPPIRWYSNNIAVPTTAGLSGLSLLGPPINSPTFTSNTDICTQFSIAPPPPATAQREQQLSVIVKNQNQYTALLNENKFLERKLAFRVLKANPQWLNLGTPADTLYQQFYTNTKQSTIGKFVLINDTASTDIATALSMNNAINDTCAIEYNRKTVNQIYLNSWAIGNSAFSSADSVTLYNIAIQEPLASGDAVYSARVMLGIDPSSFNNGRMNQDIPAEIISDGEITFSKIYPNPNNGKMQLDYELNDAQRGEVVIFDLMGNQISNYTIGENKSGSLQISEAALKNGVYFYEISVNGQIKESDKIVIIK